jgi:subtilase family serine protease
MRNPKRAWLLAGSGLTALALVAGVVLAHANSAGATPTSNGDFTYQVHPQVKFMSALSSAPAALPPPSVCVAHYGLACYSPQEIRSAYDIPSSATGAGETIVIVDAYGSATIRQDLASFDAYFHLPAPPAFNIIYPGGQNTQTLGHKDVASSWAGETSLDVEMSHALAPAATIDLVIASNAGGNVLNLAQQYAVDHHLGSVMSLSFGIPENVVNGGANNGQIHQAEAVYTAAQAANITVTSSSGDNGATDGTPSVTANFPASDPLVTSIGGTNLFMTDGGAYTNETVWNDATGCPFGCAAGPFGATGGAPSALFGATSFQSQRSTSDVAFNASVYTAAMIVFQGGLYFFGGTSEGAPAWAGIVADANQAAGHALGDINPKLYAIASNSSKYAADFHDVTVGDNAFQGAGFSAKTGYDYPTGLGSPDVAHLIPDLIA